MAEGEDKGGRGEMEENMEKRRMEEGGKGVGERNCGGDDRVVVWSCLGCCDCWLNLENLFE